MDKIHIRAEVYASAPKEELKISGENKFSVFVKEPPQNNLANQRVREILAGHHGVSVGSIRIVKGHKSPKKLLEVRYN